MDGFPPNSAIIKKAHISAIFHVYLSSKIEIKKGEMVIMLKKKKIVIKVQKAPQFGDN